VQDRGGWGERDTALRFADYAAHVGERLGDRLAALATHNEPWCTAVLGHETGKFAPGLRDAQLAVQVSHHLLLSHGLALQALRAAGVRCPLGIVLNQSSVNPATPSAADAALARTQHAGFVRWYMDPLFGRGYPRDPGLTHQPRIEAGDLATIAQPLDFLGINYYTRIWASSEGRPPPMVLGATDMGWEIHPQGLLELLAGLQREYTLPPIYITENGVACADSAQVHGQVQDADRIDYIRRHLEVLATAREEHVDVRGYFYWSLLDNFEWDSGYAKRFGLVHVDYATQRRTPKASAAWYRDTACAVRAGVGAAAHA
jgi:beta-glucosidase